MLTLDHKAALQSINMSLQRYLCFSVTNYATCSRVSILDSAHFFRGINGRVLGTTVVLVDFLDYVSG